jgi:hypothetical protein
LLLYFRGVIFLSIPLDRTTAFKNHVL